MKTIAMTAEAAEDTLVVLARHVPAGVELGRPLVVIPDGFGAVQVLTDLCWWFVTAEEAARLLPVAGGRAELTTWRAGREVGRVVGVE